MSPYEPNFLDVLLEFRILSEAGEYIRVKVDWWGISVPLVSFADVQSPTYPLHEWFGMRRVHNFRRG